MRVQIISDVHLEFDPDGGEAFALGMPTLGDVLVIAGDLLPLREAGTVQQALGWFCGRFSHVIFVPGNHEYYRTSPRDAEELLEACTRELPNLHILNPGTIRIQDTRFIGGTLWFPPTPDEALYRGRLNDFRMIHNFVPWVHKTHARHLKFLEEHVQPGDVVITHHLPHPRSIAPLYAGSATNRFFLAADTAGLVERAGAKLWIHGHTHTGCDYIVGSTRVICNPRGYPNERLHFNASLVVEC